ncbi:MAG TPA: hypothetical protein VN843_30360 [Anaerolineales bacterium]|nr:hypothetical protein [Anaerolineales bacterium]
MTIHLHVKTLSLVSLLLLASALTPVVSSTPPPPPAAPILISPVAGAVMDNGCKGTPEGITWDFDWSDVPSVAPTTRYHLKVWKNPALPVINKMDITTSSYHHTSAPSDYIINTNLTGWRWMVRAKVLGTWGAWSPVRSFKVERVNTDCP